MTYDRKYPCPVCSDMLFREHMSLGVFWIKLCYFCGEKSNPFLLKTPFEESEEDIFLRCLEDHRFLETHEAHLKEHIIVKLHEEYGVFCSKECDASQEEYDELADNI